MFLKNDKRFSDLFGLFVEWQNLQARLIYRDLFRLESSKRRRSTRSEVVHRPRVPYILKGRRRRCEAQATGRDIQKELIIFRVDQFIEEKESPQVIRWSSHHFEGPEKLTLISDEATERNMAG